MTEYIGWALPGTDPVLTGVLLPRRYVGTEITMDVYLSHLRERLMGLTAKACLGAARWQIIRTLRPLGFPAMMAATRIHLGDPVDLLDEDPELFAQILDLMASPSWPKFIKPDESAYRAIVDGTLEEWVTAVVQVPDPDWQEMQILKSRARERLGA